ncbi:hypothetical protein J7L67_10450 [bacterium]|nr:hypothetical protein [bacterium]
MRLFGVPIKHTFFKLLSLLLVELLFYQPVSFASQTSEDAIRSAVPDKYGSVRIVKTTDESDKWIIHIQDAHCNLEAQTNIAKIIRRLKKHGCMDIVLVEGAQGAIDTSAIKNYPDKKSKKIVSDYLLKNSDISGSEYFSILSPDPIEMFGVEEKGVYEKNLKSLLSLINYKDENNSVLDKLKKFILDYQDKLYSPEMKEFVSARYGYLDHSVQLSEYLKKINKFVKFDNDLYPNCRKVAEIYRLKKKINFTALENETRDILDTFSVILSKSELGSLFRVNLSYKIGDISAYKFYGSIINLMKEKDIDIKEYSNVALYSELLKDFSTIDNELIKKELAGLENECASKFFVNVRDKNLFELNRRYELLSDFFNITLSQTDKKYFLDNQTLFTANSLKKLIKTIDMEKEAVFSQDLQLLDDRREKVKSFYELALERDNILVNNALKKMESQKYNYGLLITGGFHTKGMLEILKQKPVNFAVVVPKISSATNTERYFSAITNKSTALESFIESAINSLADASWLAENPLGFNIARKHVKLAKTVSFLLTESVDNMYLADPQQNPKLLLDELNRLIADYDSGNVNIVDFKLIDGYRLYQVNINGHEMFYYFEDKNGQDTPLRETLLTDVHAILEKEIQLSENQSVTVFKKDILTVLGPRFDQLESTDAFSAKIKSTASAEQSRKLKIAVLDSAFLMDRFDLTELAQLLRTKHGIYFDFKKDFQPIIQQLLEQGALIASYDDKTPVFMLGQDIRSAYYLSVMAEKDNYFPDISQLESFYTKPFEDLGLTSIFVEKNISYEVVLDFIHQLEDKSLNATDKDVFEFTDSKGIVFEGRIIEHENGYRYFRIVSKAMVDASKAFVLPSITNLEKEQLGLADADMGQAIDISNDESMVLVLSKETESYSLSLVELADGTRPDTVVLSKTIQLNEQTNEELLEGIREIGRQAASYLTLQGLAVINDGKIKFVNIEDIRTGVLNDILSDAQIADMVVDELNRLNSVTANATDADPLESLTAIDDEDMSEQEIIKKLSGYSTAALLEVAKTTRNFVYLRILAKNTIYSMPESTLNPGDQAVQRIKSVLIDNQFTPSDSLSDLVKDKIFFEYLLRKNPDKIKKLLVHKQAMPEVLTAVADNLITFESENKNIEQDAIDDIKVALIKNPLCDDMLLFQYSQDTSVKVRKAVAQSVIPELVVSDPQEEVIIELAKNPNTSLGTLETLIKSNPSRKIKFAVASNININQFIADKLLAEDDEQIKVKLAHTLTSSDLPMLHNKPDLINDYLFKLVEQCGNAVDAAIARSLNQLNTSLFELLITQGDSIRLILASRSDIPQSVIRELYKDESPKIRRALLLNKAVALPNAEYVKAIKNSYEEKNGWQIRMAIANKQQLNEQVMRELLNDPNVRVRAALANRSDLPEDLFETLMSDKVAYVRARIAGNSAVPLHLLKKFLNDDADMSDGLINEAGAVAEGFSNKDIQLFDKNKLTVKSKLASNTKIIEEPQLVNVLVHDNKYHKYIMKAFLRKRISAKIFYGDKDYHSAYEILKPLADSAYSGFGDQFDLANTLVMMRNYEAAKEYYRKSIREKNNVCSKLGLSSIEHGKDLTTSFLNMPIQVQTILQNFHHAQPLRESDYPAAMEFIVFMSQTIPDGKRPDYLDKNTTWSDLLQDEKVENTVALTLYSLTDVQKNGFLDWEDVLGIMTNVISSLADYRKLSASWKSIKEDTWRQIISRSNLSEEVRNEMLANPSDEVEFFLRGGVRGIIKYKDYLNFKTNIVMDNVPSFLREDVSKSVWLEFIDLTENLLFSEPQYFKRLSLVSQRGSFGGFDDSLRISFSLFGNKFIHGVGDINSIVRSEGGHSISNGIFNNLGMNFDVDELQDRSSILRFPTDLDNKDKGANIVKTYTSHDQTLIKLYKTLITNMSLDDIISGLDNFKGSNLIEDYAVRNALAALRDNQADTIAQRFIGEALYYFYRNEPSLDVIDERLPELIDKITELKSSIESFSWDVRLFFEGGCYLSTYQQAFPVLMPPLDVIIGTEAVEKMQNPDVDEHYSGEWLHYLLRARMRDLLQQGKLQPGNLHRFFRSSIIYMSALIKNTDLFSRIDSIVDNIENGNNSKAAVDFLYMVNDPNLKGVQDDLKNDLITLRREVLGYLEINKTSLNELLDVNSLSKYMDTSSDIYNYVSRYAMKIIEKINSGTIASAAVQTALLIATLYEEGYTQLGDTLSAGITINPRNLSALNSKLQELSAKYSDLQKVKPSSLAGVAQYLYTLEPDKIYSAIENRRVTSAEPEKVVLKEVANHIADNLFMTGDISFAQFVKLITDYYTKSYKDLKESQVPIKVEEYIPTKAEFWQNLQGYVVPFLTNYSFVNIAGILSGFRKLVKQAFPDTSKEKGVKLQSHWLASAVPLYMMSSGISLELGNVIAVIGGVFLLLRILANIIYNLRARKQFDNYKSPQPETPPSPVVITDKIIPIMPKDLFGSQKGVVFDYDNFFAQSGTLTSFKYFLNYQKELASASKIIIFSQKNSRAAITDKLTEIGIDPALFELVTKDEIDSSEIRFNLLNYLKRNFDLSPQAISLIAPNDSDLIFEFKIRGTTIFDAQEGLSDVERMTLFIQAFGFASLGKLPPDIEIIDVSSRSPYFTWFKDKIQSEAGNKVTLKDLLSYVGISYVGTQKRGLVMSDIAGISFRSGAVSNVIRPKAVTPRLKLPSHLLETSL